MSKWYFWSTGCIVTHGRRPKGAISKSTGIQERWNWFGNIFVKAGIVAEVSSVLILIPCQLKIFWLSRNVYLWKKSLNYWKLLKMDFQLWMLKFAWWFLDPISLKKSRYVHMASTGYTLVVFVILLGIPILRSFGYERNSELQLVNNEM